MTGKKIPCCYHPTTVVLVDDDESFLKLLSLPLGRNTPCKTFNKPEQAFHFLKEYKAESYLDRCIAHELESSPQQRSIKVDIEPIADEIYNSNRYQQISVIVVDQMMPGMKGLELCKNLKGSKFKKILLTGKATEQDVIDGFNNGVIDKYIPKNSDDLNEVIKQSIKELQENYFDEQSSIILNSLSDDERHNPGSCLSEPHFVDFFKNLIKKYSIVEYYLLDTEGSFLLLDANGKPSILAVKDDESMLSTYEIAESSSDKLNKALLEKLKNKELILHFHSNNDLRLGPEEWQENGLLHPASKLVGNEETYYYAYIDNVQDYDIDFKKIVSFNDYLDQLD